MKSISSLFVALFLLGCSQEATQEQTNESNVSKANPQEKTIQAPVSTPEEKTPAATKKTQELNASVITPVKDSTETDVAAIKEEITTKVDKEVATPVVKETQKSQTEVKKEIQKRVEKAKTEVTTPDGAAIYKACASCHGQNAEKQALNKSQIIKGWESKKIVAALKGYKDGTYGGSMKAMMKGQVAKLSDAEIQAIAKHISKL